MKFSTRTDESAPSRFLGFHVDTTLRGRNPSKADVHLGRKEGCGIALKDYGRRPFLVRNTLGRWLVRRESRAYRVAAGSAGLPAFLGRVGPFAFATTRIEGRTLASTPAHEIASVTFDRLERIVDELHRRGVALGDLHHRDVLLSRGGEVHVVDLATACVRGRSPWSRWLFARWAAQDRIALARLRARFTGGDERSAVRDVGGSAVVWYRVARSLRRALDRVTGRHHR